MTHTVRDFSARYGVSIHTVLTWIKSGELRAVNGVQKPLCKANGSAIQFSRHINHRFFHNSSEGLIMARRQLTPEDLVAIRILAQQLGKVVAKRAFGPDGPGLDVDLNDMEDVAAEAAQAFTRGTLEELLDRQAQQLPDTHPCPTCGRVASARLEPRPLVVRGALIEHREPVCYCPSCRRDFFPSASDPEAGQPRLQSQDPV